MVSGLAGQQNNRLRDVVACGIACAEDLAAEAASPGWAFGFEEFIGELAGFFRGRDARERIEDRFTPGAGKMPVVREEGIASLLYF